MLKRLKKVHFWWSVVIEVLKVVKNVHIACKNFAKAIKKMSSRIKN